MSTMSQRPRPGLDRRKWIRHAPGARTVCRLVLNGTIAMWALQVRDVSVGGTCLVLDVLLPRGSVLLLELQNPAGRFSCRRQARLTHVDNGPGGNFTTRWVFSHDLSFAEADALL
jgi:hypothetical protein